MFLSEKPSTQNPHITTDLSKYVKNMSSLYNGKHALGLQRNCVLKRHVSIFQSSMWGSTAESVWRFTRTLSFSVQTMRRDWRSGGKECVSLCLCEAVLAFVCVCMSVKAFVCLGVEVRALCIAVLFNENRFGWLHRQCALTALNDVREYLGVEGGQVAVSCYVSGQTRPQREDLSFIMNDLMEILLSTRCLMPPILHARGETQSSNLQSRMSIRYCVALNKAFCLFQFYKYLCVGFVIMFHCLLFFQVFFVESVCEDPNVIAENIVVSWSLIH